MTTQTHATTQSAVSADWSGFSREERNLLDNVENCLEQAKQMMRWWEKKDATGEFAQKFELTRVFNRPDEGYSFFDTVPALGNLPVMGDVPTVFYDQPKARKTLEQWTRELREFALRYFMRISDYRLPQAIPEGFSGPQFESLRRVSFCPQGDVSRQGFGFEQLYFKRPGESEIQRFSEEERFAIVDARDLGSKYEWVVCNVRIFDFVLSFPQGPDLPKFSLPLSENQYVILSDAFVLDETPGRAGELGRYRFGYAILKPLNDRSVLAYGPGQFDAGFQLFNFMVEHDGKVRVRMPFVVNRPTRILNISLDPFDWGLRAADFLTRGAAAPLLEPAQNLVDRLPLRNFGFDPIFTSLDLIKLLTFGQAGRQLCIDKSDLEKSFLVQHFDQYYTMITGSLLTWRQIADWLNEPELPDWVKNGVSS